jgi:hypothetical protein
MCDCELLRYLRVAAKPKPASDRVQYGEEERYEVERKRNRKRER